MELQTFIEKTTQDLLNSLNNLRDDNIDYIISPTSNESNRTLEFDIAVIVDETTNKNGGGSIKIFSSEIGGKLENELKNSTVTRIKFGISLQKLPQKKVERMERLINQAE